MQPFLHIQFTHKSGEKSNFIYEFFEHRIVARWIALLQESLTANPNKISAHFFGNIFKERHTLVQNLRSAMQRVHKLRPNLLPALPKGEISRVELMRIHNIFESLIELEEFSAKNVGLELFQALQEVNNLIHQLEFADYSPQAFIHISTDQDLMRPLEAEDYNLFTPDNNFGYAYLAYETVGISTLHSYYARITHSPTPQTKMSPALELSFRKDHRFEEWQALRDWLQTKNIDASDPRSAIGLIPLARLVYPKLDMHSAFPLLRDLEKIDSIYLDFEIRKSPEGFSLRQ